MQNIQTQQMEIYASSRPIQGTVSTKAREFIMTPESVENVQENTLMQPSQLPGNIEFQIKGHLDSVAFCLDDPLTGSSKLIAKNSQTQYKASLKLIQGVPTSLGYVQKFLRAKRATFTEKIVFCSKKLLFEPFCELQEMIMDF